MLKVRDHKTGDIFDPSDSYGPKRSEMLKKSWAGEFRKDVLAVLPVEEFAKNYVEGKGRPTKELSGEVVDKYMKEGGKEVFALVKPSESRRRLEEVGNDLYDLVMEFREEKDVISMNSYKLMVRVLNEQ